MRKLYILLAALSLGFISMGAAEKKDSRIPYVILKKTAPQKTFYQGIVKRGHTAKLGFLNDVQIEYVSPVNTVVEGKLTDTQGRIVSHGDIIAVAKE
ncbi:MAG: hypothetical protein GY750_04075 [Lentisphaerae bacterium]|nr:hypothetical protein [Lentisphaerota bacterium]MCP4100591.1 hypothetical protein [Lentisphaerota bacterium]